MYTDKDFIKNRLYLEALSKYYSNSSKVAAEIINLKAILNMPKGTEHFISDIHGEHEAFHHILNNSSGVIREKIDKLFSDTLSEQEREELATIIYYPKEKLKLATKTQENVQDWYRVVLLRMLRVCRLVASKYTRSRVRKALPDDYSYILEELLSTYDESDINHTDYQNNILTSIITLGQSEPFIIALAETIKRLIVDCLHIVGDVYDRGARPDIVLDELMAYHKVDFQWGNHDILWMGAASGSRTCIANALNNAFTYGNLDAVEVGYGISLRSLALFASQVYGYKDVTCFWPREISGASPYKANSPRLVASMHKAIAVILFKLEGNIIKRNPSFKMDNRMLLHRIDYQRGTVNIDGKDYPLKDTDFPTIDPKNPYRLTKEEEEVMEQLKIAFHNSEKLQRHVEFLFAKGGLYKICNNNLLFHGCIPLNEDGSFMEMEIDGKLLHGRALMDGLEKITRKGYYSKYNSEEQLKAKDYMWFLWCGRHSPLFGRERICTFERLLVSDSSTYGEPRNAYYRAYDNEAICVKILNEFGLDALHSHIINGHIPVQSKLGESPVKANGRLIVIDGGFCRAYQNKTGIAGYTLVYNSYGMRIISHTPFDGLENAVSGNKDIHSTTVVFDVLEKRIDVEHTDSGKRIKEQIEALGMLMDAYQSGFLKES